VQENRSVVGALVAQHIDLGCGQGIQLGRGVTQTRDLGQVEALVPDGALGIDGRISRFSLCQRSRSEYNESLLSG
jgi:hypothetical protein